MSPLDSDDLHRIFEKLDLNGDGLVSLDELRCLLERIGVHNTGLDELKLLVGQTSLDRLDFLFFYDAILKQNMGTNQEGEESNDLERDLAKAFKVYDLNGDGVITCEELQSVLSQLGYWNDYCGWDCRIMIKRYDANSDGVLDFEEFKNMMLITNP